MTLIELALFAIVVIFAAVTVGTVVGLVVFGNRRRREPRRPGDLLDAIWRKR